MNKKLIAAAVSAAVVVPVTASAEVTVYGRIDNGIQISDSGSGSTTDMVTGGSRFGFKASSDLGNGMTASGRYEFGTTTDEKAGAAGLNLRLGTVSLSGSFGSVTLGNQWSAFFDTVGTHVDPTRYLSGVGTFIPYRTANTIKYANSVGPLSLELDVRVDDAGSGDGAGLGISVAVNDNLTLAVAFDSASNPDVEVSAAIAGMAGVDPVAAAPGIYAGTNANTTFTTYRTRADLSDQENDEEDASNYISDEMVAIPGNLHATDDDNDDGRNNFVPLSNVADFAAYDPDRVIRDRVEAAEGVPGVMAQDAVMGPDEDTDRVGVAAKVTFGSMFGMLSLVNKEHGDVEVSATQLWLGSDVGDSTRIMVGYGQEDHNMAARGGSAEGENPSALFAGVYHSLGGGLSVAYEGKSSDNDVTGSDNTTKHRLAMRYNF